MRLASKLILVFLPIAILPFILFGVATYDYSRRTIERQTINHLVSTNTLKEAELNRWIEDAKGDLRRLGSSPYFMDDFSAVMRWHDHADEAHENVHRQIVMDRLAPRLQSGGFVELSILRPEDGLVLISTDPTQEGKYRESEPYFIEGRKGTYLQNVTYSQSLELPVMTLATPIRSRQGHLIAVLAGRFDLGELTKIMEQGRGINRTEDTYLVNTFNFFVTEPRFGDGFALKRSVRTQGVEAALRGGDGVGSYPDYRGIPVIGAYKWLPNWDLAIITEIHQSEAFAPIVLMGWRMTAIALAMAIAATLLAFLFARTISRPLRRLLDGSAAIGRGNLDYQVGTTARDEIGELSRAFDRMTADLKTTTVSRDELARERDFSDTVINSLPGVFYLFDQAGHFVRWNRNIERVTEYSAEEVSKMTPMDFFSPDEQQFVAERIEHAFREGEASVEADFLTKSGRSVPFYFTGVRIKLGDKYLLTGVGIDVTERKRAEEHLKAALAELERSNKELEQFAYVASHDLQEPLRMVSSYTQLLAERYEGQLDEKADKYIGYAVDGAVRMQQLINDLLTYSRVSTRGRTFEVADSHALLGAAIRNLAVVIEDSQAVIFTDELPEVHGDPAQLVQLFQNLLSNAIKFRGGDLPQVHVSTRDAGSEWVFSVRDNGIGMDPQYAERIFVIFQRLHTRDEYPGTGIGLAVCKRIVERHGGRIWVESEVGKGSTFCFSLPKQTKGGGRNVRSAINAH
jgi:PAS domain S-box-containing protein